MQGKLWGKPYCEWRVTFCELAMFLAVAPGTAALVWIVPLAMEQQPHEPISAASDQLLSAGLCNNLQGILGVFCTTLWSQVQGELNDRVGRREAYYRAAQAGGAAGGGAEEEGAGVAAG